MRPESESVCENVSPRQAIRTICGGLDHPEGVALHANGTLVCGTESGQVLAVDPVSGAQTLLAETHGFVLGIATNSDGTIYACDMGNVCVWRLKPGQEPFAIRAPGLRLPNACAIDPQGRVLVTDSGSAWGAVDGSVWLIDGDCVTELVAGMAFPNGISISANSRGEPHSVYVVETSKARLVKMALAGSRLTFVEVVATFPDCVPDGVATESDDLHYVCCYRPDQVLMVMRGRVSVLARDDQGRQLAAPTNAVRVGNELVVANHGGYSLAGIHL